MAWSLVCVLPRYELLQKVLAWNETWMDQWMEIEECHQHKPRLIRLAWDCSVAMRVLTCWVRRLPSIDAAGIPLWQNATASIGLSWQARGVPSSYNAGWKCGKITWTQRDPSKEALSRSIRQRAAYSATTPWLARCSKEMHWQSLTTWHQSNSSANSLHQSYHPGQSHQRKTATWNFLGWDVEKLAMLSLLMQPLRFAGRVRSQCTPLKERRASNNGLTIRTHSSTVNWKHLHPSGPDFSWFFLEIGKGIGGFWSCPLHPFCSTEELNSAGQ